MGKKCYLRKAAKNDMQLSYNWINDNKVRSNSFNSNLIELEEYSNWFKVNLELDTCDIFIYMIDQLPVGQIMLKYEKNIANVDYSIDKKYRGQGHGSTMLVLVEKEILHARKDIEYINAEVKIENIATRKKLEKLGYKSIEVLKYSKRLNEDNNIEILRHPKKNKGLLLLTNNMNAYPLYEWLVKNKYKVYFYSDIINQEQLKNMELDFIISYNYNYIIEKECIDAVNGNIVNLHISYLPWNRGFSPNFWSFIDDTPKGVTIHMVNEKLDKGEILIQKELFFNEGKETFKTTYLKLNNEIKNLFYENWDKILNKQVHKIKTKEKGSYHNIEDLNKVKDIINFSWDETIQDVKNRYKVAIEK